MITLNRRAALLGAALPIILLALACGSKKDAATQTPVPAASSTPAISINPTLPPQQAGAAVIFVVDQSESMSDEFGVNTKWDAIADVFSENGPGVALNSLSERALIGLSLFSGSPGESGCPLKAGTSPGAGNLGSIASIVEGAGPLTGAPVGDAIDGATTTLAVYPGSRTIILITDGLPGSCNPNASAADALEETLGQILVAYTRRVYTKVIAIGDDAPSDYLQSIANAGEGIPPSSEPGTYTDAEYWQASNPAELEAAIEAAIAQVEPIS